MKSEEDTDGAPSDTSDTNSVVGVGGRKEDKDATPTVDPNSPQSGPQSTKRLDRKESYKAQRRSYAKEKKRVERELLSTFKDQSIIVLADWLKIRGSLKSWTKLWCVLKPGLLLLYKSPKTKSSHWIGTIILSTCELIERPSKKDGFCFKLFHPMDQSIWAAKGPEGESMGAVVQPLPTSHLIFRAPNNAAGKCWMDALELALRCSSLLLRTMSSTSAPPVAGGPPTSTTTSSANTSLMGTPMTSIKSQSMSAPATASSNYPHTLSDPKEFFPENGGVDGDGKKIVGDLGDFIDESDDLDVSDEDDEDEEEESEDEDGSESSVISHHGGADGGNGRGRRRRKKTESSEAESSGKQATFAMTTYEADPKREVFGDAGDQTEEFSDENKSIVWFLVKQVRPGMDLSKVVLPTFILEPRSFLDKISDYYYHADILSEATKNDSPFNRMKLITKWYLSGFYKKPKGLKKPYNPIIGETFRCYWQHENGSKTFYISEQVSHHPPISAFYVANRQDGFTISASILAKSKFYGNSLSAILEGVATLSLLPRGEDYKLTMPYAHCKGILMGTMTMELGGKVYIECGKTGYSAELEFKLRPFLGGGEFTNAVSGKIKLGKETLATIDGHWDSTVMIKEKKSGVDEILWEVNESVRNNRLRRFTVPIEDQGEMESAKLWRKVGAAIDAEDQVAATEEKFVLEERQRNEAKERKAEEREWEPKLFQLDPSTEQYVYNHSDARPWDDNNDLYAYESDFVIRTKTKHKTPMVRTQSIVSVSDEAVAVKPADPAGVSGSGNVGMGPVGAVVSKEVRRGSAEMRASKGRAPRRRPGATNPSARELKMLKNSSTVSGSSQDDCTGNGGGRHPSGGGGGGKESHHLSPPNAGQMGQGTKKNLSNSAEEVDAAVSRRLEASLGPLRDQTRSIEDRLGRVQLTLDQMSRQQKERDSNSNLNRDMVLLVVLVVMIQAVLNWVLSARAQQAALGGGGGGPSQGGGGH